MSLGRFAQAFVALTSHSPVGHILPRPVRSSYKLFLDEAGPLLHNQRKYRLQQKGRSARGDRRSASQWDITSGSILECGLTRVSTEPESTSPPLGLRSRISPVLGVLCAVTSVMVVASCLSMYQRVAYINRAPDPSGIKLFRVVDCLPDLQVVDKFALSKELGPIRLAEEEWYCAGQWDDAYFSRAKKLLEDNGLLMSQLNRMPLDAYNPYERLPLPAANFIKVVEVAALLSMDVREIQDLKNNGDKDLFLPAADTIARISASIDINRPVTIPDPLPQVYELKSKDPRIRLITNIGLKYSLHELSQAIHSESNPDPDLQKTAASLKMLAGGDTVLIDPLRSKNSLMAIIGLEEVVYLNAVNSSPEYLFRTHDTSNSKYPDLDMIVLSDPERFAGVPVLGDRDGYYDNKNARIFARVNSLGPLPPGEINKNKANDRIMAAIPPSLEHEFFHYLFFRPSISFSGFIVEGEATAYGEYEHQMMATGVQSGDEMSNLFMKTLSPGGATGQETEALKKLIAGQTLSSSPTKIQCDCALTVYRENVVTKVPIPLRNLLSLSTPLFQSGLSDIIAKRYAYAWTVYHTDLILQKRWGPKLEGIAGKLKFGEPLSDEDNIAMSKISTDTLEWLDTFVRGHEKECEHILENENSPGRP